MSDEKMLLPFTVENWLEHFYELDYDPTMLLGYMHCLQHILPTLEKIAKTKQSFAEIKNDLDNFNKGQRDLISDIDRKWYSDEPEKYHLPRLHGHHPG